MTGSLYRVFLICEGSSDPPRARAVMGEWLRRSFDWCDGYTDAELISTVGDTDTEPFLPTSRMRGFARSRIPFGVGAGLGSGDGGALRRVLLALKADPPLIEGRVDVIVWLRDGDGDAEREPAARAARNRLKSELPAPTVVAYAHQCGEAWVIAGFQPTTPDDERRASEARKLLQRSHLDRPWDLSHVEQHERSAKQVRTLLTDRDEDREIACLRALMAVDHPCREHVGLAAFLKDLTDQWAPELGSPRG